MRKRQPFAVLLMLLFAALPEIASCQDESGRVDSPLGRTVPAQVKKAAVPGITNFSRVENAAGFGGATQPSAMARLKNLGFSSVISLRLASEPDVDVDASGAAAQTVGLNYVHLPFDSANPDPQLVHDFLAAVGDEANQPVYIHCASATRAAALWMIKRVFEDGWEIDEAREEAEVIALKPSKAVAFATQYITSHSK
jgi:uncharacterized protein (TIGR01244 family)